jgi:hypothetical protein
MMQLPSRSNNTATDGGRTVSAPFDATLTINTVQTELLGTQTMNATGFTASRPQPQPD